MTPTQGRQQDTLPATIPKTPWKPRIALTTQVAKLLDRGMTDNYESEHSITADHATQAEMSPTRKMEELLLPLETSSQTSVDGTDGLCRKHPCRCHSCNSGLQQPNQQSYRGTPVGS